MLRAAFFALCALASPLRDLLAQTQAPPVSLGELLEPLRAKHELPALAGAIVAGSEVVAIGAVGERERGLGVRVTADDRWHFGSCTKAMTATLAARLVEKDVVEWTTTIGESFPDLRESMHAKWRDVPLEWLLQNRAGVCGEPPREVWDALWSRKDAPHEARRWFVERLLALEPVAEPGTKFVYSNQGFTIAGAMLEARAKKPWEELMREQVFAPLGMSSAGFGAPGSVDAVDQPRGHRETAVQPGPGADNPAAIGPAGTVHGSLRDWARFVSVHLGGERGNGSFLSPATFQKLHEPAPKSSYAMGWNRAARSWAGGDVLTHAGSNTMWFCVVWIAPAKDHAFLAATNAGGESAAKACDEAIAAMVKLRKLN